MRESRYNTWAEVDDAAFVHNGVSGELVQMSREERAHVAAFLAGSSLPAASAELLERLVRARVVTADDVDELAVLEHRYSSSRRDTSTLGFTLITSLGCNFDCPYCYEEKHPSLMRPEVCDQVVRIAEESAPRLRSLGVTWLGGEPLLGLAQLLSVSDRLIALGEAHDFEYQATIITNGWLLDGETARQLAARRVRRAQVTLDGPPDVHDRMRPRAGGGSTFGRVVDHIVEAVEHLAINVRINVDQSNFGRVDELLELLAARDLAGRVVVGLGRLYPTATNESAPSASWAAGFSSREYAQAQLEFHQLARHRGFRTSALPMPGGTPCTAVRSTEVVVGPEGELWKCWEDVGDEQRRLGSVFDYGNTNDRLGPWLTYDPFSDPDCRSCIALPSCMGGCAVRQMFGAQRDDKCGSFRYHHEQLVRQAALARLGRSEDIELPVFDSCTSSAAAIAPVPVAVPVVLSRPPRATVGAG